VGSPPVRSSKAASSSSLRVPRDTVAGWYYPAATYAAALGVSALDAAPS
jgi:hypothetical protein